VVSPFRQSPMRGAFSHWIINGYKRMMQQAVYFAVPIGLGELLEKGNVLWSGTGAVECRAGLCWMEAGS
jgi:hypothetical protein